MVSGQCVYSTSLVFQLLRVLYNTSQYSPPHTHNHTLRAGEFSTKKQPALQELIYTHSHTNAMAIGSNLGFGILAKDTSTCRSEEPGIDF